MMRYAFWRAALRVVLGLPDRIRREPILLVGLALAALQAYQQAVGDGLTGDDIYLFVTHAVLTWFARELVYPAIKVERDPTLVVKETEPVLPPPAPGDAPRP